VKVSKQVADERRRRLRDKARRNCLRIKRGALEFADRTTYVTNVGSDKLSLKEVFILARARWQIELIFKLWKSRGQIDEWRGKKPWSKADR
jgi:IS4 transposase